MSEGISVEDSPFQPERASFHNKGLPEINSRTKVQFNTGTSTNVPHHSGTSCEYHPELEVPDLDEIEDKSKVEKKLEERCEKLEEIIRSMQGVNTYGGLDARELSLVSDLEMPPKFKAPDFEKFDGTSCPSAHLTMTWRDLSKAFLEQYKHIADMVTGRTALQSMEQKPNESFRQYAQRWRDMAAQVQPPLLESEVTLLFVNTLKDDFYDRMLDHAPSPSQTCSYVPGHSTGIIIGQPNHVVAPATSAQSSSKPESRSRREKKEKPTFTPIPIRYEELFPQLVESRLVAPRYIAPIQPPYPPWFNPNVKCDYHPGHHIDNCTAFKFVVEQLLKAGMLSFEAPEKNLMPNHKGVNAVTEGNDREVKENLSNVIAPLKWDWERLVENGILKGCCVTSGTGKFYEYHKSEGHEIRECEEFKRLVQAMMDNKELELFTKGYDCGSEDVCASEDAPTQGNFVGCKPLVIKVSPKGTEVATTATSGLVIKTPAPFPYKDSKQVPWKYVYEFSGFQKTEENVNEVGNFTRSGRCYSAQPEVEPSKNQKGKAHVGEPDKNFNDEPEPKYREPIKKSEAKEFLKILKHSEFNAVERLNKLPTRISMLSLLLSSEPHRNTLLKLLNQTFVPKEISVDMVDRLVGNIAMDNFISFSDEEIPKDARGSYKALHITTRCKGYILPGVLVDNGSALNVLPLVILKKLSIDSTHMKAYHNTVRAFDGTQRDVLGKITVPLLIGPIEHEVDFVVMNIKPTYSCLLGRPWIHAAGAVPSTLHQKLKFVIDGKLVTIQAEEDIIASIATNTPYIEMEEDAMECSFRSLELVSATFVEENKRIRRPRLSRCVKMQVRRTLGEGARIGRGFGKHLQGRLYPKFVKGKYDRFGLGYQPSRRERIATILKNKERRRARLNGEDAPWDQMTFLPIGPSFVSGGLLDPEPMEEGYLLDHNQGRFKDSNGVVDGSQNRISNPTSKDLSGYLEGLTIIAGENPYLGQVRPCPPGFELNNWIAEELPVVFKSSTKVPDISGVSSIVPDLQVDFEQNLSPEEFINCEDDAGCDLPNDLLRMMESEEKHILPYKKELEIVNLGTKEERREVKIGTTISAEARQNLFKLLHE
ncbi:hypothetical protein V6N13_037632 [Hibiscus sabdariffa]